MAKNSNDIIIRDRMQATFDGSGNLALTYGRINLDDYVSAVDRKALRIKEMYVSLRAPATEDTDLNLPITGEMSQILAKPAVGAEHGACIKVLATTRAYSTASELSLGSPDLFHLETWTFSSVAGTTTTGNLSSFYTNKRYGPMDFHPAGFPVISDVLVGLAADKCTMYANSDVELDVFIIAERETVTQATLTTLLTQQNDA
jgi:hypothetical protein